MNNCGICPDDFRSLDPASMSEVIEKLGESPFRAKQIFRWLHKNYASSFSEMTNISRIMRERLNEEFSLHSLKIEKILKSSDGTIKFGLLSHDGHIVESVLIPEWSRYDSSEGPTPKQEGPGALRSPDFCPDRPYDRCTLCISTQVGCAMGCDFCRTAGMGLVRNLGAGEIVDQVYRVSRFLIDEKARMFGQRPVSNIVFMGMGEPLANYDNSVQAIRLLLSPEGQNFSSRHVTVSTCGIVPALEKLARETPVKIAVSLNSVNDEIRNRLMPVNRKWNISKLINACRKMRLGSGRRITFEYILLSGITDSLEDADKLAKLLSGIPSKINLIPYNESCGLPYKSPAEEKIVAFREYLADKGLTVMLRRSRGRDIDAACGQLAGSSEACACPIREERIEDKKLMIRSED